MYKENLKNVVNKIINEMEGSMLSEIHGVICDDSLDDFGCVEKIIEIFEEKGFSCGGRHDF